MTKFYHRWQTEHLIKALKTRRVLLLNGARQCGKTTLAKQLVNSHNSYRSLDDLALRELAENDPAGFVRHQGSTLIIDEIQRVPALLSAIKLVVDEDTRPGQYILTGSANIQSLPGTQESLAGRISKIRLRPLSQGELVGTKPDFLKNAFKQSFSESSRKLVSRNELLKIAFRGGFPEAILLNEKDRSKWHRDYINALLERDLKDIAHITRQSAMHDLVKILAAWSGKFMDIASIATGLSIARSTLETYINALETLYIVERLPPWTHTDYERVGKQYKLFMNDCGLMTSILHWYIEQVELDSDRSGKLIETFVFTELAAIIDANNDEYTLYHYRDREKREIDFMIEREDHALLGIEVKAGSAISSNDFKHLKWFRDNIAKERPFIGIVLYTGNTAGSMGKNLWAVPFSYLWKA